MAAPAITVLLYRMRNPNGTSKDWAVPTVLDPQRLTVYFGRTGSTLRQAETPAGRCRDGIPIREAEKRIREKMAKGYQALGTFRLAANRRDLRLASTSPPDAGHGWDTPETSNAVPALYWRWRPTGGVETARRRVLDTACTEIIAGLAAVGWTLPGAAGRGRDPGNPGVAAQGSEPTAHRFRWRYLVLLKYHPRGGRRRSPRGGARGVRRLF